MPRLVSLFDITPLREQLQQRQLIITPNQRLASRITSAFSMAMADTGTAVINVPRVYSIELWIDRLWQSWVMSADENLFELQLLTTAQEQALWAQVVQDSAVGEYLLRPEAAAKQAASAYRMLAMWQLDPHSDAIKAALSGDADSEAFLAWVEDYSARCRTQGWINAVDRASLIVEALKSGQLAQEKEQITLVAIDELAPLYRTLLDNCGEIQVLNTASFAQDKWQQCCETEEEELWAAAVWAKQRLRADRDARVAVVVPDLTSRRAQVVGVFQQVFEPEFIEPGHQRRSYPFNLSAGIPLRQTPLVNAAMDALQLFNSTIDLNVAERLLQSPFYCLTEVERPMVADSLRQLRRDRQLEPRSARLRQIIEATAEAFEVPWALSAAMQTIADLARKHRNERHSPASWIDVVEQLLRVLGWPGRRTLDTIEYQQLSQWQQVLENFTALAVIHPTMDFSHALSTLNRLLSEAVFQPQTADSTLQILGVLEAAGLEFDHLWLTGMSDQQWPPAPKPNPLLPVSLQRQYDMPGGSAERELRYALQLSQRLAGSSRELVVSYAAEIDERPAGISGLWRELPSATIGDLLHRPLAQLLPPREIRRRHLESVRWLDINLDDAPAVTANERISGGVSLFANQAACPFRAFARHRLKINQTDSPSLGLNPAERGEILHRALELMWNQLKTQHALVSLQDEELAQLLDHVSEYALQQLLHNRFDIGTQYRALEKQRTIKLLHAWVAVEKQRAAFSIEATEQRLSVDFHGLTVNTRVDRIDRLSDGSLAIIDYKSGKPSVQRWWGERPEEPQLPFYCVSSEQSETVSAIAFAQLNVDGLGYKAVGDDDCSEPLFAWNKQHASNSGAMDWPQLKKQWQETLAALADDFVQGKAAVDPKSPPATCQYCDLAPVCRFHHRERAL